MSQMVSVQHVRTGGHVRGNETKVQTKTKRDENSWDISQGRVGEKRYSSKWSLFMRFIDQSSPLRNMK